MPAVLFEAGVIVNRNEELLLRSASHQKELASALAAPWSTLRGPRAATDTAVWLSLTGQSKQSRESLASIGSGSRS